MYYVIFFVLRHFKLTKMFYLYLFIPYFSPYLCALGGGGRYLRFTLKVYLIEQQRLNYEYFKSFQNVVTKRII